MNDCWLVISHVCPLYPTIGFYIVNIMYCTNYIPMNPSKSHDFPVQDVYRLQTSDFDEPETLEVTVFAVRLGSEGSTGSRYT